MIICNINFDKKTIQKIEGRLQSDPQGPRRALARDVCTWLNWRDNLNKLKISSCMKAFSILSKKKIIIFPEIKKTYSFQTRTVHPKALSVPHADCERHELGRISLTLVKGKTSKSFKLWREIIEDYHYLKNSRTCGGTIKYLVNCTQFGTIGALSFSSGKLSLKDRDDLIGWSERARRSNIGHVVNNNRFVILPTVRVKNLASKVFSIVYKYLPEDWEEKYGVRPIMLETFVNPDLFEGTCYKASGWVNVGNTAGRRDGPPKKIFIKPLKSLKATKRFLRREPPIELEKMVVEDNPEGWIEEEFSTVDIRDKRLRERCHKVTNDVYGNFRKNTPEKSGSNSEYKSTLDFFRHRDTSMDIIISGHASQTTERVKDYKTVLIPQDTTTLNYTHQRDLRDFTPINQESTGLTGFFLHASLALTDQGTPLGLIDSHWHKRLPKNKRGYKKKDRHQLSIHQKESYRWITSFRKANEVALACPETQVISISDREGDIFDLFHEADQSKAEIIVRNDFTKKRRIEGECILDLLSKDDPTTVTIDLRKRGKRKPRKMTAEIRYCKGLMDPPKTRSKEFEPIMLSVVEIKETSTPPAGERPAHWVLITTIDVSTPEAAFLIVKYYNHRWNIETYFKVVKSGCRILTRQSIQEDTLRTAIAIDLIVAYRVMCLTMMSRETPDVPCTVLLSDDEQNALQIQRSKDGKELIKGSLTLGQAVLAIAMIGGYLNRKSDPPPGVTVVWRGLETLKTATEFYKKIKIHLPP